MNSRRPNQKVGSFDNMPEKDRHDLADMLDMEAAAKISELEVERDALKAELHEARMQSLVDFGKLQKAFEENVALREMQGLPPSGTYPEGELKRRMEERRAALEEPPFPAPSGDF